MSLQIEIVSSVFCDGGAFFKSTCFEEIRYDRDGLPIAQPSDMYDSTVYLADYSSVCI